MPEDPKSPRNDPFSNLFHTNQYILVPLNPTSSHISLESLQHDNSRSIPTTKTFSILSRTNLIFICFELFETNSIFKISKRILSKSIIYVSYHILQFLSSVPWPFDQPLQSFFLFSSLTHTISVKSEEFDIYLSALYPKMDHYTQPSQHGLIRLIDSALDNELDSNTPDSYRTTLNKRISLRQNTRNQDTGELLNTKTLFSNDLKISKEVRPFHC